MFRHKVHHFREPFGIADTDAVQMCISFDQVKYRQPDIDPGKITDNIDVPSASQRGVGL